MQIKIDKIEEQVVIDFLKDHMYQLSLESPPESNHYLGIDELKREDVTFWTAWEDGELLGCGAIKEIEAGHGEVKSMRTSSKHLRKGVGKQILLRIIESAKLRGYHRISLETGSLQAFIPAQKLYESCGFTYCAPFADYQEDPNCVFMTLLLEENSEK
ncbi:putative N-acetyltransferase YsnE [Bacillus sp. THAF10]|uniref:GNAT family N-acetyltransferase n=1 Tax=Bacillus sp. THAF10 TaxID=2587848 RepID=UPI0012682198|nr:GNAT family N-acetyltransferase [Bacillus sp. THAF10]QFT89546.1 putative N-acetyltransferase YsnE [Bacillus sp. THAF10]